MKDSNVSEIFLCLNIGGIVSVFLNNVNIVFEKYCVIYLVTCCLSGCFGLGWCVMRLGEFFNYIGRGYG